MVIKSPPNQPLQIPKGWIVRKDVFCELEPDAEPKYKAYPHDNGWGLFEDELFVADYESPENLIFDMGWHPNMSPDGKFVLRAINNTEWQEAETLCETRSLKEITNAINNEMLRISLENGDYTNGLKDIRLQGLRPLHGWRFVNNEFLNLDPTPMLPIEQWKLFHENLLRLEDWRDRKYRIEMGWFPAHDPNGLYVAKLVNENLENSLLNEFSSKSKDEIVEYLNQAISGEMMELSEKRERSEKERRRQQRLTEQRNAQAK